MAETSPLSIDPRSGFCESNSTFYSKRKPLPLPANQSLDITTFISSLPHHGNVAFIEATTGRHLTFFDLWLAVDAVASSLSSDLGIRKGHIILILAPNSIYFPIVCLAVMSLGAVITTANPLNTAAEIASQIADSKPILAFTTPDLVHKLANSKLPIILLSHDKFFDSFNTTLNIVTSIEEMMRKPPQETRVKEQVNQDDTATILYSSGTTGTSKGVVSSHRNLIAMVQTLLSQSRLEEESEKRTYLCTIPMFHIYGLVVFATGVVASGYTVVILPKFDMEKMLTAIRNFSVTNLPLVPPILVTLINNAETIKKKYDLSSVRRVVSGGAPLSKEVIEMFYEKYPNVLILQGYGMTESTGVGASANTVEESRKCGMVGAVGILVSGMEGKIVDPESGESLPVNRTGELWLRGPCIMKGYFCNKEATKSILDSNGWLKTGDLCYIDEDGFVFVVDRLKDLIKYKGYQVAPAELEALLLTHTNIVDVAVIPLPDKEVGQFPMAYVVRKTGSTLSGREIMDFINKQVAPYKKIRRVEFVASIPKNPSGKILRKDLVKLALARM